MPVITLKGSGEQFRIIRVGVSVIIDLRHRVLRPGKPIGKARFDGDDSSRTYHFAMMPVDASGQLKGSDPVVCCASFMHKPFGDKPAWQLRGMATEAEYRSRGLGEQMLAHAEAELRRWQHPVNLFWCNAQVPAIRFYEQNGWACTDDPQFDIEDVGPHRKMTKPLQ